MGLRRRFVSHTAAEASSAAVLANGRLPPPCPLIPRTHNRSSDGLLPYPESGRSFSSAAVSTDAHRTTAQTVGWPVRLGVTGLTRGHGDASCDTAMDVRLPAKIGVRGAILVAPEIAIVGPSSQNIPAQPLDRWGPWARNAGGTDRMVRVRTYARRQMMKKCFR